MHQRTPQRACSSAASQAGAGNAGNSRRRPDASTRVQAQTDGSAFAIRNATNLPVGATAPISEEVFNFRRQ